VIEFGLTDEQTLVAEMAGAFAARELRPAQRGHEDAGVSAATRDAAAAAGLGELWSSSVDTIARCAALEALAAGDAGATLALIGPAVATAAATRLGARTVQVDAAQVHAGIPPDDIPWLPIRAPSARLLQLDRDGGWRVVVVGTVPIATLGLHAAGGARATVTDTLAAGAASPAAGALAVAELRLAVAAMCVGVGRASLEYACAYVQERSAFGKRLADHQAIAFTVADMAMAIAAARALVHRAALELDAGVPTGAADAFVDAAAAALFATDRGVQLLGGHGYLKDHPVEKWMRDARTLALCAGGRDAAADDAERDALERPWT
jgi:alkylation response protein AidB-like acyl-CoA dehydrogenase